MDIFSLNPKALIGSTSAQPLGGFFLRQGSIQTSLLSRLRTRLRQFGSTTDFVSYLVEFLIHLLPYFQTCFCFTICRYRNHVCKSLKIFPNVVFDCLNLAFWDTERNAKTIALYKAPFMKKSRQNCQKLAVFNKKCIFDYF